MDDNSYSPAFGNGSDFQSAPPSLRRSFFFSLYSLFWIAATVASSLYVQQRDGAGWPVAIWAMQMLLMGFVQIPSVVFFGVWPTRRRLHGKPPGPLLGISTASLLLVIYFATAIELYSITREILALNNQPLHEVARQGFLWGLKTGTISILTIAALTFCTISFCAFFMMLTLIAIRIASGTKYPAICDFCKKPLPILLPAYDADWFGNDIPLPNHVTKDEIRKCPHCSLPVLPAPEGLPKKIANYVGWSVISILLVAVPALRDGWGWPTILWGLELILIPFGITPFALKCFSWVMMSPTNQNFSELPNWKKIVLPSLFVGTPMGSLLGVILCLRYDWKIPLPFAGQLGLLIGPLCIACCLFPIFAIQKLLSLLSRKNEPVADSSAKT